MSEIRECWCHAAPEARAVRRPSTSGDGKPRCACGCGRRVFGRQKWARRACRHPGYRSRVTDPRNSPEKTREFPESPNVTDSAGPVPAHQPVRFANSEGLEGLDSTTIYSPDQAKEPAALGIPLGVA
jgi:hypothetical protein